MNKMLPLDERMKLLVEEQGLIDILTDSLMSLHEKYPETEKFIGWHMSWFVQDLVKILPDDKKHLAVSNVWDYSFYDALKSTPGIMIFSKKDYPALVECMNNSSACIVSVDYCRLMFHMIEGNANALRELAELLTLNNEPVWFAVPAKIQADDEVKNRAIISAMAVVARQNPRKFPSLVKELLHEMGYDVSSLKNKEIDALFEKLVSEATQ